MATHGLGHTAELLCSCSTGQGTDLNCRRIGVCSCICFCGKLLCPLMSVSPAAESHL